MLCIDIGVTDHNCILFNTILPIISNQPESQIRSRIFNSTSASIFCQEFASSEFQICSSMNTNDILNGFNSTCSDILDRIAPFITKKPKNTSQPWINEDIRSLKRICRKAERKWKATRLTVHLDCLKILMKDFNLKIKNARAKYLTDIIEKNQHNTRVLFNIISRTTDTPPTVIEPSTETCEEFLSFFSKKVSTIRNQITPLPFVTLDPPINLSCSLN